MPKFKPTLAIKFNLLKPQSNPEKLPVRLLRWLLSTGRYLLIFVEALVLIAFIARFKLDADLAAKKEAIEEQIPYIESLKPYEILIRQTQLKLSTIGNIKKNTLDWAIILKKIADQTPTNTTLISINMTKDIDNITIRMTGSTQINSDLANFIAGLKEDNAFSNINLGSVSLEQGVIKFAVDAAVKATALGTKSL